MNKTRHQKLRAAGWFYDPLSDRYSAPGVALDGEQKMYDQADAWQAYETAQAKLKQQPAKDAPTS